MAMMHSPTYINNNLQPEQANISIITVCLNAGLFIESAINSVSMQSFKHIEHIVIDGGSLDGTVEILKRCQHQQMLKYISEPDGGIYEAMNKGIKMATGKWIFFLGSDDVFNDDQVLERIFACNYKEAEIIYGNVQFLHSGAIYDGPFDHEKISIKNICHQGLFVQKSVFDRIGLFNTRYRMSADYEFNLRWMGLNIPSQYVPETVVIYNEKGLSGQVWDQVFDTEFYQLLIHHNIVSTGSFEALKKKYNSLLYSTRFKTGSFLITPFSWVKNKFQYFKK
jgi:glycosyltransferase involved in cell wall biosynthesis